jgi:hypothetical protein
MASHPSGQPTRRPPAQQQVYKPRESLVKFTQFFPLLVTGVAALMAIGIAIGYYAHMWLIPVMMVFPLFSTIVGATIANRLSKSRVVIDQAGLRVLQGDLVQSHIPWNQVTRLTVRQERGDNVYEVWAQNRPVALAASYYENGEQLLAAVSARTNRPWERQRDPQADAPPASRR